MFTQEKSFSVLIKVNTINFVQRELKKKLSRGHYREFMGLRLIFIGGVIRNTKSGSMDFSSSLLLRNYFNYRTIPCKSHYTNIVGEVLYIFTIQFYVDEWFEYSLANEAPDTDLNLLKV